MNKRWNLVIFLVIFFGILFGGTIVYSNVEGWNTLDSAYFVVITATTIGYGDLIPQTDTGKIFTIFFSFFGVASVLYIISLISKLVFKKHVEKKADSIKRSIEGKIERGTLKSKTGKKKNPKS